MRAVREAIDSFGLDIQVFGLVKNDKHRTRALIDENRREIPLTEELMNFVTAFQDEVHKVAIEYHRKVRDKQMSKSALDDVTGIGEVKKKELLKTFGSIERIKNANIEELTKIKGINDNLARKILEQLEIWRTIVSIFHEKKHTYIVWRY